MAAPALPPRGTKPPPSDLPLAPPVQPKESFWKPVSDFFHSSKPPAPKLPPVEAPNGLSEVTAAFAVPGQVRKLEQESTKVPSYAVLTKRPIPPATPIVEKPTPAAATPAPKADAPKPDGPKPPAAIRTKLNTTFSGKRRDLVNEGLAIKDTVMIDGKPVTLSYVPEAEQPGGVKNAVFPKDVSGYQRENTILIGNHTLKICFTDFISSQKEVIVNAANKHLGGGSGVDGAVHTAGNDALGNELYGIEHKHLQYDFAGTFTEGYAAIIPDMTMRGRFYNDKTNQPDGMPFELKQSVIVVAGPDERGASKDPAEVNSRNNKLYLCYRHALELAHLHGKKSIAFPPIAIGIFEFNKARAAACAMKAVKDFFGAHPNAELDISIHHFLPKTVRKESDILDWNDYQRVAAEFPNSYDVLYRDRDLKLVAKKLGVLAGQLQTDPGLAAPINQPRPHFDLGSGAVNSALQMLTHTYGQFHPKVQAIAGQDLSGSPDDYNSLEARMQSFAPITDKDPERILFKWSYFIYLKALQSGSDAQLKQALVLHHQISYAIGQHRNPKFVPNEVANYLDLWSDMMGIHVTTEGAKPTSNKSQGVLRISTATDASFLDAVKREFAEKRIVGKPPSFIVFERSQEKALPFGNGGSYFQTPLDLSGYFKDPQRAHYTLMGFTQVQPGGHRLAYVGKTIEAGKAQWFKCHDMTVEKVEKFDNAPVQRAEALIFVKVASPE